MVDIDPREGFAFTVTIENDSDVGTPWQNEDGHGPVSEWTSRAKLPGELILVSDSGKHRYYDFAKACEIALRDGWNAKPYDTVESLKERASRAARADYERLRQWCDGQWNYVGVIVTASREGIELGSASLWGIESDAGKYLDDVAQELSDEALDEARATLAKLCTSEES